MGHRLSSGRFDRPARALALGMAVVSVVALRPVAASPGDIFTVAAPAPTAAPPKAEDIRVGDASVASQTGALNYSYPIQVPPGRRVAPTLGIAYSSQAALYGTLAAGWTLTGIPWITRDVSEGRLRDPTRRFVSSLAGGRPLIPVSETAPAGAVSMRAQNDGSFARYQYFENTSNCSSVHQCSWRVLLPNGTTYFFGDRDAHTSACGTVSDENAPLTRIVDEFGNQVDYVYEPGVDGECRIKTITWGQHATDSSLGYFAAVHFNYASAPITCPSDVNIPVPVGAQISYRTGGRLVTGASQLDSMTITAFAPIVGDPLAPNVPATPDHTRTISLQYNTSCTGGHAPYRALTSIQESAVGLDSPAVTLPPVTFEYGNAAHVWPADSNYGMRWLPYGPTQATNLGWGYRFQSGWPTVEAMMLDIDADGLLDRVTNVPYTSESGKVFCRAYWERNQGNLGVFGNPRSINMPTLKWASAPTADPYSGGGAPNTAFPNDPDRERCALNFQRTGYLNSTTAAISTCANGTVCPAGGFCADGSDCTQKIGQPTDTYFAWRWFDIDGDGRVDLVGSPTQGGLISYNLQRGTGRPGSFYQAPQEPAIFSTFPPCPQQETPPRQSYSIDDVDPDAPYTMCRGMFPWFVYKNHGDGNFGLPRTAFPPVCQGTCPELTNDTWGPRPDMILYQPLSLEAMGADAGILGAPGGSEAATLDIDGDGTPDGVYRGPDHNRVEWNVFLNDGTGQLVANPASPNPWPNLSWNFPVRSNSYVGKTHVPTGTTRPLAVEGLSDVNGDGLVDQWKGCDACTVQSNWSWDTCSLCESQVAWNNGTQFRLAAGIPEHSTKKLGTDSYAYDTTVNQNFWVEQGVRVDSRREMDLDGDGRADLLAIPSTPPIDWTNYQWPEVHFNQGGQFSTSAGVIGYPPGLNRHIVASKRFLPNATYLWEIRSDMLDLDGDGIPEGIDFGDAFSGGGTMKVSRIATPTAAPRLLTSINNNRGLVTTVAYSSMHGAAVTQHPDYGKAMPHRQWVVHSLTATDSLSGTSGTSSFHYTDPVHWPDDRGQWSFRGFEKVQTTTPSGAKVIEQFSYTPDWSGRLTTKLVRPAATDVPTPAANEVRSVEDTTWEARSLFGGSITTYHATIVDRWTCKNGQDQWACRDNLDTRVRTVSTLTPIMSTTGPDFLTPLLWQLSSTRLQAAENASDSDRATTTTFVLHANDSTYRLRPHITTQLVQANGAMVMYGRSSKGWDASYRVAETDSVWFADGYPDHATTRRSYDMTTGNVIKTWRPKQWDANPNTATNPAFTELTYDSRKLFVATERSAPPTTGAARIVRDYIHEYGTGTKLETQGPNIPPCAVPVPHTCAPNQPTKELHRIRVDGLGRTIERYETHAAPSANYVLFKVQVNSYQDGFDGNAPPSITRETAIDHNESTLAVRYRKEKTELDGQGRPTRRIVYVFGSAPNDEVTSFIYRNDGTLSEVRVPDPSLNNANVVSYTYAFDSLGRPTAMRRPDAESSGVNFSYEGLVQTSTEVAASPALPATTVTTKDAFGRLVRVEEHVGEQIGPVFVDWAVTEYEYDAADNVRRIVNPDGITTCLYHDLAGRRTRIARPSTSNAPCPTEPDDNVRHWRYGYDRNDNLESEVSPCDGTGCASYSTTTAYDDVDRPSSKIIAPRDLSPADVELFGAHHETFQYDSSTNGTSNGVDRLGLWKTYGSANAQLPTVQSEHWYTATGQQALERQTSNAAGYNNKQRSTYSRFKISGSVHDTFFYDIVGTQNCQNGSLATYSYDERALPWRVQIQNCVYESSSAFSYVTTDRNVAGLVTRRYSLQGNHPITPAESNWTYDKLGRVSSQIVKKGSPLVQVVRQDLSYFGNDDPHILEHSLGTNLKQFQFGYDRRHQLKTASETTTSGYFSASYQYSADGRFTHAVHSGSPQPGGNVEPRDVEYEYQGAEPEQLTALIDPQSTIHTSYAYDLAGNRTMRCSGTITGTQCSGESLSYQYDGKNQLRRAVKRNASGAVTGSEEYWYDGSGKRNHVVKRDAGGNKTGMIWFIQNTEAHYDAAGTVTKVYGHVTMGTPVFRVERNSDAGATVEYQFHGLASNTIAAIDQQTGTVNASFSYAPFGEIIEATNAGGSTAGIDAHRRRMNDKYVDQLTDLAYYGYRYYDKTSMTWTQSDPLYRFEPDAAWSEPRRGNLYTAHLQNPMRYLDPDGRDVVLVGTHHPKSLKLSPSQIRKAAGRSGSFTTMSTEKKQTKVVAKAADIAKALSGRKDSKVAYFGHGRADSRGLDPSNGKSTAISPEQLANAIAGMAQQPTDVYLYGCNTEDTGFAKELAERLPGVTVHGYAGDFEVKAEGPDTKKGFDKDKAILNPVNPGGETSHSSNGAEARSKPADADGNGEVSDEEESNWMRQQL